MLCWLRALACAKHNGCRHHNRCDATQDDDVLDDRCNIEEAHAAGLLTSASALEVALELARRQLSFNGSPFKAGSPASTQHRCRQAGLRQGHGCAGDDQCCDKEDNNATQRPHACTSFVEMSLRARSSRLDNG